MTIMSSWSSALGRIPRADDNKCAPLPIDPSFLHNGTPHTLVKSGRSGFSKPVLGGNPLSQEKASAEIRGEYFRTKSWVNFAGDFFWGFFGPFSLEKTEGKNPPKNPRRNSNQNLGVSQPKSILQGSALHVVVAFVSSVVPLISANPALNSLVCGCLN